LHPSLNGSGRKNRNTTTSRYGNDVDAAFVSMQGKTLEIVFWAQHELRI
jgi:hypothetical protein